MSGFHGILLLRDWAEAFGPLNPGQQTNSFFRALCQLETG
jgi:hypothetical protein